MAKKRLNMHKERYTKFLIPVIVRSSSYSETSLGLELIKPEKSNIAEIPIPATDRIYKKKISEWISSEIIKII